MIDGETSVPKESLIEQTGKPTIFKCPGWGDERGVLKILEDL